MIYYTGIALAHTRVRYTHTWHYLLAVRTGHKKSRHLFSQQRRHAHKETEQHDMCPTIKQRDRWAVTAPHAKNCHRTVTVMCTKHSTSTALNKHPVCGGRLLSAPKDGVKLFLVYQSQGGTEQVTPQAIGTVITKHCSRRRQTQTPWQCAPHGAQCDTPCDTASALATQARKSKDSHNVCACAMLSLLESSNSAHLAR